jgi:hypothetical protein
VLVDDEVAPPADDDPLAPLELAVGAPMGGGPIGAPNGGEPPPWPPLGPPLAFEFDSIARNAATSADRVVDVPMSPEDVEVVVEEASEVAAVPAASLASVGVAVA